MSKQRFAVAMAACALSLAAQANDVDDFRNTWAYRALSLQSALDEQAPLAQSTFLGTHNSYNSRVYQTPLRYIDPNQERSVYDQLRMGARALEFDVHSYTNTSGWVWQWHKDLLLCHGQSNHLGCSGYDRPLPEGLAEIRRWIDETASRPEVLVLYIESHIDSGDYGKAVDMLSSALGNVIYRPAGGSCRGMPMDMTKREILASGKRILLMTDGCKDAAFNSWVFTGTGDYTNGYPTDSQASYQAFPACHSAKFNDADYLRWLVRFYEDRTTLSSLFGDPDKPITGDMTESLLKCGANLFGFDKLTPFDGRMEHGVWSWAPNEPNNWGGIEHCAQHYSNGRFNDARCDLTLRFACKEVNGNRWYITASSGPWSQGFAACYNETGAQYRFAVPYSARDNERLNTAKQLVGASDLWLNYTDQYSEGNWRVGP